MAQPDTADESKTVFTTATLLERLRQRYSEPPRAYAYFEEVADATSTISSRRCDAMAMGLWASRGMELTGFEVKASRSDWLRELKDPSKSDGFFRLCDRWFLVAPREIVKDEEVPTGWGLLVPHGKKLRAAIEAPKLVPAPASRAFLASLCRRIVEDAVPIADVNKRIEKAIKENEARTETYRVREHNYEYERQKRELEDLKERVKAFESASGVNIGNRWTQPNTGKAFAKFLAQDKTQEELNGMLEHMVRRCEEIGAAAKAALAEAKP